MKNFLLQVVYLGFSTFYASSILNAQDSSFFIQSEIRLASQYSKILEEGNTSRENLAVQFFHEFFLVIDHDSSYYYSFDKLGKIGKIYSPDRKLRIYSWNIPVNLDENLYYGLIQFYSKQEKKYKTIKLIANNCQEQISSVYQWHGALYYQIAETKYAGQKYYTLLGLDLNNSLSNKKIIDIIKIDDLSQLNFCPKLIEYKGKMVDRLVFEYNKKAIMTLHYDERKKMIIFDHLSPQKPSLEGKFQFYGPDFTYDGLKFEDGHWKYYANITITN
jgi:hypothetical protein